MINITIYPFSTMLVGVCFLLGCAKPDHVTMLKSPRSDFFYTIETFDGKGAISADSTSVYAHLERNGKADKKLVLNGEYLLITKAIWIGPNEAVLCVPEGLTDSFRNQVTLTVGDSSETIRTHLQESTCGPEDRPSSPK